MKSMGRHRQSLIVEHVNSSVQRASPGGIQTFHIYGKSHGIQIFLFIKLCKRLLFFEDKLVLPKLPSDQHQGSIVFVCWSK